MSESERVTPMRTFKSAVLALVFAFSTISAASAADLGFKVHDFAGSFTEKMRAAGTDVPLDQPRCSIKGVINCLMNYGSLEIFVDSRAEGSENANELLFKSKVTTPIFHTLEGLEYSLQVLRPDLAPLAARRMALRIFENLIVTTGAPFTDVIDEFKVQTSEQDGAIFIQINSAF